MKNLLRRAAKAAIGKALPVQVYSRAAGHSALRHQFSEVFRVKRTEKREQVWDWKIEEIGADTPVLLIEFGVWQGYSTRYWSEKFTHPDSVFVGCDSFIGLPEDWGETTTERFNVGGNVPQIDDPRVRFVKGWFQNSFAEVAQIIAEKAEGRTVLIHYDADIYSSTLFLLCELHRYFDAYHFVFDEFTGDEDLALWNHIQAYGASASFSGARFKRGLPVQVGGMLITNRGKYEVS
ncbi:class I SAM-dependent methyltransferase [Croceicoccus mobilis]|uniref:Methyltransferase n=1 Tax=Croceicoccus mobilis TaxID=1703339 RepID=A0A916YTC2_9SPHN|nr:class I SAM-dependent methyltransferase [Croceicoccus mobilis]GGD59866.1 hypothetical protein GCM10010990_06600 [Croceicoccus mobilis]